MISDEAVGDSVVAAALQDPAEVTEGLLRGLGGVDQLDAEFQVL
jgi:hypothetical protein